MKLDLAVVNGLVYIDGMFRMADIGIKDEKIAMITQPGYLREAAEVIDAAGKYVIPGGIDTHVHFRDPGHAERGLSIRSPWRPWLAGPRRFWSTPFPHRPSTIKRS